MRCLIAGLERTPRAPDESAASGLRTRSVERYRRHSIYLRREAGGVAASRMIERIRAAIRKAREMPAAGVPRPEYRSNCRFVAARPYLIYYDFDGDTLIVLRVLHQARDRDRLLGGEPSEGS